MYTHTQTHTRTSIEQYEKFKAKINPKKPRYNTQDTKTIKHQII